MASKKKKIYKASAGAIFTSKQAQAIGEAIERIGESVTPKEVVDAAREDPVLHACFEWDNTKAAAKYRLFQARNLINHIVVVVSMPNGEKKDLKAFYSQSVTSESEDDESTTEIRYLSINVAKREPEVARNIVEDAKRELRDWRRRYDDYRDYFGPLFGMIDGAVA